MPSRKYFSRAEVASVRRAISAARDDTAIFCYFIAQVIYSSKVIVYFKEFRHYLLTIHTISFISCIIFRYFSAYCH